MYGVIIEEGPENWQIIQQKDGFAEARSGVESGIPPGVDRGNGGAPEAGP